MQHIESALQKNCVTWFRLQYPKIGRLLFAVPNGGAGVADVILLYPAMKYNCLCIEFKTGKNSQQPSQKEWQALVEVHGGKYIICRSFDQFREEIQNYLIDL